MQQEGSIHLAELAAGLLCKPLTDHWVGSRDQGGLPNAGLLRRPTWTNKTLPNSMVMSRAQCPLFPDGSLLPPPHPCPTMPGKEGQPRAGGRAMSVLKVGVCRPSLSVLAFALSVGSAHQCFASKVLETSNNTWYLVVYLLFFRSCRYLLLY